MLKTFIKRLLFSLTAAHCGGDVFVRRPRTIVNPDRLWLGGGTTIGPGAMINAITNYGGVSHNPRIVMGERVHIVGAPHILCAHEITIGDECVISHGVLITDNEHGFDPAGPPIPQQPLKTRGPVHIGKRVFIGYGACIFSGVTLGDYCRVGAGAVVTKSFPARSVIAGQPARLIRTLGADE